MKKSNAKQIASTSSKEELAIQNLRSQKQKHEKALHESGAETGRFFVLEVGEDDGVYLRMMSLARQEQRSGSGMTDLSDLMLALDCNYDEWVDLHGSQAEEAAWVRGFVHGALETFRKLESKL